MIKSPITEITTINTMTDTTVLIGHHVGTGKIFFTTRIDRIIRQPGVAGTAGEGIHVDQPMVIDSTQVECVGVMTHLAVECLDRITVDNNHDRVS